MGVDENELFNEEIYYEGAVECSGNNPLITNDTYMHQIIAYA